MKPSSNRGSLSNGVLLAIGVACVFAVMLFFIVIKFVTVPGNKIAVKETWSGGVDPVTYGPRTYKLYRWTEDLIQYDISGQVFVMNDKTPGEEGFAEGRHSDALEIVASDKQRVIFHTTLQWHRDQTHVVEMHKAYRDSVEERLIRPREIEAVRTYGTIRTAIDLYSGQTLEDTRVQIEKDLKNPQGPLALGGVIVDSFIIDKTILPDKEFVAKIEARQRAIIAESAAIAQEKANLAEANAAKAKALTQQFEDVVKAETSKKTQILAQEADSEKTIIKAKADAANVVVMQTAESEKIVLAAKAEADRQIAVSNGNKQAEINRAVGIEAIGKAEAEKNKLLFTAYSAPGADLFTRIEVAKSYAAAMDKVRFYPANATFTAVAKDIEAGLTVLATPSGASK